MCWREEGGGGPLASDAKRPPLNPPLDERQCVPCRRKKAMSADSKQPNGSSSRPPVKLVACNRLRTTSTSVPAVMRNTKTKTKYPVRAIRQRRNKGKAQYLVQKSVSSVDQSSHSHF